MVHVRCGDGRVLLDICIPTYNRCQQLNCTVSKLLKSIVQHGWVDRVRIHIADNASTDGTDGFLRQLSRRYPFVKLYRQTENVGFAANVLFLWKQAEAEYVWCISDDDFYGDGLLTRLIRLISGDLEPDSCLVINSFHYVESKNGRKVVADNLLDIQDQRIDVLSYGYGLKDIVTSHNFTAFGLLGALVFPTAHVKRYLDMPELRKSSYPHQLLLFKCLYGNPVVVLNVRNMLGWRAEGSNWALEHTDRSFHAHFSDYVDILGCTKGYLQNGQRREIYKTIYRNAYWAIVHYMIANNFGVVWSIRVVLARHVMYHFFSVKLDLFLLLVSCVKLRFFRGLVARMGVRSYR